MLQREPLGVARRTSARCSRATQARRRAPARSRRRSSAGRRSRRHVAVDALLDQLDRGVVLARDDDARGRRARPPRRRPGRSPRAARSSSMHIAPRERLLDVARRRRSRARRAAARRRARRSPSSTAARSGPSPKSSPRSPRSVRPRWQRPRPPAARASRGSAGRRTRRRGSVALAPARARSEPAYSPSSTVSSPRRPLLAQARGVQLREAERPLGHARAQQLNEPPDRPAEPPKILAPVLTAPHLVPVDHQREARPAGGRRRPRAARSRETTRCARRHSGARCAADATVRPVRTRAAAGSGVARLRCTGRALARRPQRARRPPARAKRRDPTGAASGR